MKTKKSARFFHPANALDYGSDVYPRYSVTNVRSGAGTFAPNVSQHVEFATETEARDFIRGLEGVFIGTVELLRMNDSTNGVILEREIKFS